MYYVSRIKYYAKFEKDTASMTINHNTFYLLLNTPIYL